MDMNWQTLVPELILEILSKVLPGLTLPVIKPKLFPWYLGHICGSWRAAFKSSPRSWSALVIDPVPEGKDVEITTYHMERALLLTEMCLQQSKNHPLSFQFRFNGTPYREDSHFLLHCHKMLKAMMAHSTRWLDAYFYLSHREVSMLYAVKTQLPILRAFRLTCYSNPYDENRSQFRDLFEDASQVRHVWISDYPVWKLNWSSITTIHLHFTQPVRPELLVEFLPRMERLEDLYIDGVALSGSLPRITLPFLRCLGTSSMESLFFFETPMLEDLYIDTSSSMSDAQVNEAVSKMLGQPLSHLRRLILRLFNIKTGAMISQYLPDIQDIRIYVLNVSNLKILSLCPAAHLETITVGLACSYNTAAGDLKILLMILRLWRTQSKGITGFGRFEGLKQFTLELESRVCGRQGSALDRPGFENFESRFTRLFSERGVQCSIRHVRSLHDHGVVPPFDIFGA